MTDGLLLTLASAVVVVTVVGVMVTLATDDRDPSVLLAWLLVIILVPLVGLLTYFLVGRNLRTHEHRRTAAPRADLERPPDSPAGRVATTVLAGGGSQPLAADTVRVFFAGEDKFRDLLADLATAERSVHLMYLIWEQDELSARVTEVLLDRLAAGVQVRILYDWLSSLPYKKAELRRLAKAGAVVVPCYRRPSQLNYRNHMKIVVIDGAIVYSGGMNLGQEYIDGGPRFARWRDTHFRLTGPVVTAYLDLYASIWARTGGPREALETSVGPPAVRAGRSAAGVAPGTAVQVLHSSASTPTPAIRNVFIVALTNARRRVWIQSPYFVPDEPTITAMCVAASSGVDVRLMMTGLPDKRLPFYAAHAYFDQALAAGVRIYQYTAGFLHSKSVLLDDELVVLGTCNWDIRSLLLHDEVVAVFHDSRWAGVCADRFEADLESCHEVTPEDLAALGALRRARNSVCRLTSRLL